MKKILPLNTLANLCGYFYNAYIEKGVSVNNGYNCRHPEQEEQYDGVGCCFAWSCPIAYQADGLVCQEMRNDCEYCGNEECYCDMDMMVYEEPEEGADR